MNQDRKEFTGY